MENGTTTRDGRIEAPPVLPSGGKRRPIMARTAEEVIGLEPMGRGEKRMLVRMHEYLMTCFPRYHEDVLYEIALELWRMGR